MMSKKVPRLFFAGEVLDVDGITGGFNFQHAWRQVVGLLQRILLKFQKRNELIFSVKDSSDSSYFTTSPLF
ncbi:MAG: hypothetical protein ABR502_04730 [Chitinophagaceae bacterium]